VSGIVVLQYKELNIFYNNYVPFVENKFHRKEDGMNTVLGRTSAWKQQALKSRRIEQRLLDGDSEKRLLYVHVM
jgi:hypothetical protein